MATNIPKAGSYTDFTSLSKEMELIPVSANVSVDLGLFRSEFLNTDTLQIARTTNNDYALTDVPWGTRVKNHLLGGKAVLTLSVPHFGGEDAILPRDVKGKFDWEDLVSTTRPQTVQRFVARKMAAAKRTIANTWMKGQMQLINLGTTYAPNGTVVANYFTEFGVTQSSLAITLSNQNLDPKPAIKAIIRNIQDNFQGGFVPSRFVGLCDRGFFDDLEGHAFVRDAVKYFEQDQSVEILTGRLGTKGYNLDARYQALNYGGVTWICAAAGEITANEARVFPVDVPDMFVQFFAPSEENFDIVNDEALEAYYFEYMSERRDRVDIHYETNVLWATLWPKALVKVTKA
jgi:Phage major capsid protein E